MDQAKAIEVLGLDEEFDEASVGRSKKKLCHKNRADADKVAEIEAAADFLLAALTAGEEAVAPVAPEPAADPMAALNEELAAMKTSALNKRARELGVDADAMDDAADEDDPKAALIALIVAASPVPEPAVEEIAAEPEVDPLDALKQELSGLKTGALNKKAREVGVDADAMDDAADEDDPKAALIALIVAKVASAPPEGTPPESTTASAPEPAQAPAAAVSAPAPTPSAAPTPTPQPTPEPTPAPPPAEETPVSDKHKEAGNKAFKLGDMDAAIAAYTKAIEALPRKDHPKASTFYSNRAACYKNLSDFKAVVRDCTASLEVDPNNWKARLRRGYAYEGLASEGMDKYLVNALDDMRLCSNFSPDARRTANRLATTVRQMAKLDEKLAAQQAKLDAQPSSSTEAEPASEPAPAAAPAAEAVGDGKKAEADALKAKGNEAFKKKEYAEAVKQYTAAIKANPNDETYYSNRSGAYLNMGKTKEALKDAEQCIMVNGSWDKGFTRKVEGAIQAYTKANELMPDTAATVKALADCKARLVAQEKAAAAPPAADTKAAAAPPAADPKKAAAMLVEREGWLSIKEGKIRKKWVKYWYQIRECKLIVLTCEPGGNVPPETKGQIDLSTFTAVAKSPGDPLCIDLGGVEPMQLKADMEMSANMWVKELSIACMV